MSDRDFHRKPPPPKTETNWAAMDRQSRDDRIRRTLIEIAGGRLDNGRPLPAEQARQLAREVCIRERWSWSPTARQKEKAP
jgi:hypothetical protein